MSFSLKKRGGFTLIELLVCSVILSVSALGILNLLRMSDSVAMRGRLDSRAALVFRDVVEQVSTYPYAEFKNLVVHAGTTGPNGAIFVFGDTGGSFPFYSDEDATVTKYLLLGKPLLGETDPSGMYPYVIMVEAKDEGDFSSVRVTITWEGFRDRNISGEYVPSERVISLQFQKWDASQS